MSKRREGFTIIEVMIVLAIAGLIMLIVFLAVPALQRNARNTQRKADVSQVLALVHEYKGNHGNKLPNSCNNTSSSCFVRSAKLGHYDNQSTTDNYISFWHRVTPHNSAAGELDPTDNVSAHRIAIRSFTKCTSDGHLTGANAGRHDLAAQFLLETARGYTIHCQEF